MAGPEDNQDRTEAATPRRLQKAREEGQVPVSRELSVLAGLAAATLVLALIAPRAAHQAAAQLSMFLGQPHRIDLSDGGRAALAMAALVAARLAGPFVLAALVGGVGAALLQTGLLLRPAALRPKFSRVDPRAGIGRLFGPDNLVEAGKASLKLAAMGAACWYVLAGELPHIGATLVTVLPLLPEQTARMVLRLLLAVLAVQAVVAGADVAWVRLRHARGLRMSREEIREELKESDGDPRIKQRVRQIRMQRARKRMLAAVPKATVIVTNPTHYAVALAYDRATTAAPRVVAKGVDSMAARIREVAAAHRVPVTSNPPLARALYRVEVDAEIPAEHYQAVAEIIAYVWRLGQRAQGRP